MEHSRAIKTAEEVTGVSGWEVVGSTVDEVIGLVDYTDYVYEMVKKTNNYELVKGQIRKWRERSDYQDKVFVEVLGVGKEMRIKPKNKQTVYKPDGSVLPSEGEVVDDGSVFYNRLLAGGLIEKVSDVEMADPTGDEGKDPSTDPTGDDSNPPQKIKGAKK